MNKVTLISFIVATSFILSGCDSKKDITTGIACSGSDNDSLVESLGNQCKTGDAIVTKYPAYFCDFNYSIAYNDYNSAFCIYSGNQKQERTTLKPASKT